MRRALLWAPAVAHMAFIFAASSVPGSQIPGNIWDKLAHLLVYAVLGIAFTIPLSGGRWRGVGAGTVAVAIVLSLVYGISDEIHQHFTPGRTPDVMDVVADTIGAAAGAILVFAASMVVDRLRARPVER
ncbi:MAG TPA: VanZ family protein [Vicinamibacterales bacterium]|nr:VanZ family protein [Vicinamibacterales bacterium]